MSTHAEKPGTGTGTGTGTVLLDHERLQVYWVAREFMTVAAGFASRKMPQELRAQFHSATMSMMFNIGEGAGKKAKADKQRSYEIAKGSTMEAATQLDLMNIHAIITREEFINARKLLVRVAQMLTKLSRPPRTT